MTSIRSQVVPLVTLVALLIPASARAQSIVVPVQGYLVGLEGAPVNDPALTMTFAIYDAPDGGEPLFAESLAVPVDDGHFTVFLGSRAIDLDGTLFRDYDTLFLGMQVRTDAEMRPRLQFGSVPYAAYSEFAGDARSLDGLTRDRLGTLVDTWARSAAYDTEGELTELLDDNYLSSSYVPEWAEILGIPEGFADGVDDNTTYTAGAGLNLDGTEFSVDEEMIRETCFDTEDELTAALDDRYAGIDHTHELDDLPEELADGDDDALGELDCSPGQIARFVEGEGWRCHSGHNIRVVQNQTSHGWFNNINRHEPNAAFRVTIDKQFDDTPLRIVLNEQVGSNGNNCAVWGAIEVQVDRGDGFRSISNPGACSQAWYDNYDYTWHPMNLDCLAFELPAGRYTFRVVYSCNSSRCGNDCHLGNWNHSNADGTHAFQRRLIVEELY